MKVLRWLFDFLYETTIDLPPTIVKIALRSLFFGPFFYGLSYWLFHHRPTHEMWITFFLAAIYFTPSPKRANKEGNKDAPPQKPSPIILPASMRHGREDFRG